MNKYVIELSNNYKLLSDDVISIESKSPTDALQSFLNKNEIYCEIEESSFSNADARVISEVDKTDVFFRIIENTCIKNSNPNVVEQGDIAEAKKLITRKKITVYHGTKNPNLTVDFNYNNKNNDYGKGFYTTPYEELGKEWAYASYTAGKEGYLYTFSIDLSDLSILDLTEIDSMHWVAELIEHRNINTCNREALEDTIELFKKKYKLNTTNYDVIIGYRADDSYFSYVEDFLSGVIYRDTLESALRNGKLGIQVFIKSKKAFDALNQIGNPVVVPQKYRDDYIKRDKNARNKYAEDRKNQVSRTKKRVFDLLS